MTLSVYKITAFDAIFHAMNSFERDYIDEPVYFRSHHSCKIVDAESGSESMSQVLVLNGPNLNLLGNREPDKYGKLTLADVESSLRDQANELGTSIDFYQSNSEGMLIDRVQHAAREGTEVAIVNPAGYSHTSVALRDAFLGVSLPFYEVHVSNIYRRESFRHHSYFSDIAIATLAGFGAMGYNMALSAAVAHLASLSNTD